MVALYLPATVGLDVIFYISTRGSAKLIHTWRDVGFINLSKMQ